MNKKQRPENRLKPRTTHLTCFQLRNRQIAAKRRENKQKPLRFLFSQIFIPAPNKIQSSSLINRYASARQVLHVNVTSITRKYYNRTVYLRFRRFSTCCSRHFAWSLDPDDNTTLHGRQGAFPVCNRDVTNANTHSSILEIFRLF